MRSTGLFRSPIATAAFHATDMLRRQHLIVTEAQAAFAELPSAAE